MSTGDRVQTSEEGPETAKGTLLKSKGFQRRLEKGGEMGDADKEGQSDF